MRFGEVLVGLSLFLGLFTRLGGFFGIVLPLNYMAVRGAIFTLDMPLGPSGQPAAT